MQNDIRKASKNNFSRLENFIAFKANNELLDPAFVSEKYFKILEDVINIKEVVFSLKDYK